MERVRASEGTTEAVSGRPTIVLDEGEHGMEGYLRDLGGTTVKRTKGAADDEIVDMARAGGIIVVTGDSGLLNRCRRLGIRAIDVGWDAKLTIVQRYLEEVLRGVAGISRGGD